MKLYRQYFAGITIAALLLLAGGRPALAQAVELSLGDSIAMALKNNADILIAKSDREKTYWALKQARAGKGVSLGYTHSDSRYNTPPTRSWPEYVYTTAFDNEISLSVPVYSGGKLESQISQAELNLKVADLNIEATRQQLKLDVTTYYYNVLQCRNELKVSQETVGDLAAHLKNVQAQYDVGIVAKSDLLSSEVQLANAQDSLIKAENQYELAVATLNNAIRLPLDSELILKEDLSYEKYDVTLAACSRQALASRPEIAQYQTNIAIAREDVKIAQSGLKPSVTFAAAQDWYDDQLPGAKNSNWLVSLTLSMNVFDAGLTHAQISQAQYSLAKAREQARQNQDAILLEVREDYLSMREAEKRIETSRVAVNKAAEDVKIAEVRYNAGIGTNLDVIDAVLALNEAKMNYFEALYDYNIGKAKLDRAMGVAVAR